jgi:hypothetical protein
MDLPLERAAGGLDVTVMLLDSVVLIISKQTTNRSLTSNISYVFMESQK